MLGREVGVGGREGERVGGGRPRINCLSQNLSIAFVRPSEQAFERIQGVVLWYLLSDSETNEDVIPVFVYVCENCVRKIGFFQRTM